jgi:hypothetical protein
VEADLVEHAPEIDPPADLVIGAAESGNLCHGRYSWVAG